MLELLVSRFEPDDLARVPRQGRAKVMVVLALPLALVTAGTGLLLARHHAMASGAVWITVFVWVFSASVLTQMLRRRRPNLATLTRQATVMSPTRLTFDADRLRIEQPVGRSALAYTHLAAWRRTPTAFFLHLARGGAFVVPRRYVTDAVAADVEAFLRTKDVRVG